MGILELNMAVSELLVGFAGNYLLDHVMIISAEYASYLVPPLLVAMWFHDGKARYVSFFVFFTVVVSILLSYVLGGFYYHPRPYIFFDTLLSRVPQNSFPSQHAATMFPLAFTLLYKNFHRIGYLMLGVASVNAFARMYVGFHFPLDILVGTLLVIPAIVLTVYLEDYIDGFTEFTSEVESYLVGKTGFDMYRTVQSRFQKLLVRK